MPIISIIVPVYNVEKFLPKCIDSILVQTYTDFELLLIDDGSPDKSGEICDQYARMDNRVKVFHMENGGVSSARNYGIEQATGKWLCFVDSDDTILPTYLADFEIGKAEADIYMQGYVKKKEGIIIDRHNFSNCKGNDFFTVLAFSEENCIINSPCFKLYKRDIVKKNGVRFDLKTSYGEDHLFSLLYIMFVRSVHYSMGEGYVYRINETESLTQRIVPVKEIAYYALQAKKYHDMICNKEASNQMFTHVVGVTLMANYVRTLKYLSQAKGSYMDFCWVRNVFLTEIKDISTDRLSLKHKVLRWATMTPIYPLIYCFAKA